MFRKPNSTMTAVEIVSSMYDGPIPADIMMQARAEDAAFRADPKSAAISDAVDGIAWNTLRAHESIGRIRDARAVGDLLSAESERKQVLASHLQARRRYQQHLVALRATAA